MPSHGAIEAGDIHLPYNWAFADAAERTAYTDVEATDLGKLARQLDDNSIWMLTAVTPMWVSFGGGGTVTANAGALTANAIVLGAGTTDTKVVAGITTDGTSRLQLGVAGTSVGGVEFRNATSGTISLVPVAGALGTAVLTLPAVTDTLVALSATQTLTNKTLTAPIISTISNTGTLTLPTSTDTLVGRATTDTLTNKTLTAPVISTISNTGTLTLPTSTDTLVGRATTDTLTNKTLGSTIAITASITFTAGVKQTFAPDATTSGLNVGSFAGVPSALANGDLFYDSVAGALKARIAGSTVSLGAGGGGTPGGSDTQVQFNDAGAFGGDAGLTFNKTTDNLFVTGAVRISGGALSSNAANMCAFDFLTGGVQARWFSNGTDTSTNGKFLMMSQRSNGTNSINVLEWDTTKLALTLSGSSYFHVGAAAYALGAFSIYNSFQIPFAKTDATERNAFFITTNDAANPLGFGVTLLGHASTANSRTAILSVGDVGTALGVLRLSAYTYDFTQQSSSAVTSTRLTSTSTQTTLEALPSNAGVHIKPNGTGYTHFGASAYATAAFSIYNTFAYPVSKSTGGAVNAFFIGSNDASNPFGLNVNITGHATAASRIIKLQAGAVGVDSAGEIRIDGTLVALYGTSSTLCATANNTQLIAELTTAATSTTDGALRSKGGLSVAGATVTGGAITTGAPSGGTAAAWKFGAVAVVSPTAPNRTIELDVAGTRFFLHAKTTND